MTRLRHWLCTAASFLSPLSSHLFQRIQYCLLSLGADMRRREFITLLGGAATAWPLAVRAQQTGKLPTIGFFSLGSAAAVSSWVVALVQRLNELGWIEGRTVAIEYRWADGRSERLAEIAAELVRRKVDVIVTHSTAPVIAAKQATATIPIVFTAAADPVGNGLIASLSRPGGNVTGVSSLTTDLAGSGLNSCASLSLLFIGWRSCLTPTLLAPCWRCPTLKRPRARSGS